MYGYIYITTNLVNGKRYIGQKKAERFLAEGYLGSGKLLLRAIEKYGRSQFITELLEECSDQESLDSAERKWITYYDAANSSEFYNIADGATGGNTYKNLSEEQMNDIKSQISAKQKGVPKSEEHRRKHSGENAYYFGKKREPEMIEKMRKTLSVRNSGEGNPRYGTHWTEEQKKQLSDAHKQGQHSGANNGMYGKPSVNRGKVYIHNNEEQRIVDAVTADKLISEGWIRGRLKK